VGDQLLFLHWLKFSVRAAFFECGLLLSVPIETGFKILTNWKATIRCNWID
jgi:hypothetical protein